MAFKANFNGEMDNPTDPGCSFCADVNRVYASDSFQEEMWLPESIGQGYYRKIFVRPSMEISITDMTFHQNIVLDGCAKVQKTPFCMFFCLGSPLHWRMYEEKREFAVETGDSCMYDTGISCAEWEIPEGTRLFGLNIHMGRNILGEWIRNAETEDLLMDSLQRGRGMNRGTTSLAMKAIVHDMLHCRMAAVPKRIYLESKIIELIALFLDEIVFEDRVVAGKNTLLSRTDMENLHRAKAILDADIGNTPTLNVLARKAALNEYKLKTGFKELFGMPVHAYVIDRRLEKARFLLEREKLRVTAVAHMVGYSELGQFARKFREKFGVNPSEYLRRH